MSKLDEKVILYKKFMDAKGLPSNIILLTAITKGLGPSIYKKDSETVSGSDANELSTVKNNFLIKKLGLLDTDELNTGIKEVMKRIGTTERKSTGLSFIIYWLSDLIKRQFMVYKLSHFFIGYWLFLIFVASFS